MDLATAADIANILQSEVQIGNPRVDRSGSAERQHDKLVRVVDGQESRYVSIAGTISRMYRVNFCISRESFFLIG